MVDHNCIGFTDEVTNSTLFTAKQNQETTHGKAEGKTGLTKRRIYFVELYPVVPIDLV